MNWNDYLNKINGNEEYQKAVKELKAIFDFGDAILRKRIEKGWSQTELARRVGTRQANISRIEAGLANPTLSLIQKISDVLEIEIQFTSITREKEVFHKKFRFVKNDTRKFKDEIRITIQKPINIFTDRLWSDKLIKHYTVRNETTDSPILVENWPTHKEKTDIREKTQAQDKKEKHD